MNDFGNFIKIAGYLSHPLVLVGFVLFLFFGIHKFLITSGIIKPVSEYEGSIIVKIILRYGFIIALVTILAGFVQKGWQDYVSVSSTTRDKDAKVAVEQVRKEIFNNFINLSILIKIIDQKMPTPFWDKRRANETELAYQDRAKSYFRDYQHEIRIYLQESKYSQAVYQSYQRNLSYLSSDLREHIENVYHNFDEIVDSFNRFETGLTHILSLDLTDSERNTKSIRLHQEKIVNAKIAIVSAAAQFCLILTNEVDAKILSEHLELTNIKLKLKHGKEGYQVAMQEVFKLSHEKAMIFSTLTVSNSAGKREIERRIEDPYLVMLRKAVGLGEKLSEDEIFSLQNKKTNMEEKEPSELFKLAAFSYLESDGHGAIFYYERALKAERLSPILKQYAQLSLDRLNSPEKYESSIGIMIFKINPGGSFDKAGLKVGDVLVSLDGETLYEPMDIASKFGKEEKSPFLLKLIRNNEPLKIVVDSGESVGAVLTQLIVLNAIQL